MSEYTGYMNQMVSDPVPDYFYDEDFSPEIDFINDNLRSFGEGLSELLYKCGYSGADTNDEKQTYLDNALKNIGVEISRTTLKSWFEGGQRPNSKSRLKVFQICFALRASLEDTIWFFHHIYFDRCFDFHQYNEVAFYYCIKHGKDYSYAQQLLKKVEKIFSDPDKNNNSECMTVYLYNELSAITDEETLLSYFAEHKNDFGGRNITAAKWIKQYKKELSVPEKDRFAANQIKKYGKVSDDVIKECGLLMQWIYHKYSGEELEDILNNANVASNDFILSNLLSTNEGISKNLKIPDLIKYNFPSKKTLSDIISSNGSKGSYDAVRKMLIAFYFMRFWCQAEISDDISNTNVDLYEEFICEMNESLFEGGYGKLFPGNPYDWLFMRAANSDDPIEFIRSFVSMDDE